MIKHGHPSYYFAVKMKDDVLGSKMAAFWSYFKTLVKLVYRMRTGRSQEKTTHGRVLALTMRKTRVVPGLQNTQLQWQNWEVHKLQCSDIGGEFKRPMGRAASGNFFQNVVSINITWSNDISILQTCQALPVSLSKVLHSGYITHYDL